MVAKISLYIHPPCSSIQRTKKRMRLWLSPNGCVHIDPMYIFISITIFHCCVCDTLQYNVILGEHKQILDSNSLYPTKVFPYIHQIVEQYTSMLLCM